jgi:hypothetical protein
VADLARFDWRARGSSKYGSLPLAIYVQYAFIDAPAELTNEWCALSTALFWDSSDHCGRQTMAKTHENFVSSLTTKKLHF